MLPVPWVLWTVLWNPNSSDASCTRNDNTNSNHRKTLRFIFVSRLLPIVPRVPGIALANFARWGFINEILFKWKSKQTISLSFPIFLQLRRQLFAHQTESSCTRQCTFPLFIESYFTANIRLSVFTYCCSIDVHSMGMGVFAKRIGNEPPVCVCRQILQLCGFTRWQVVPERATLGVLFVDSVGISWRWYVHV